MTLFQSFKDYLVRKYPNISMNVDPVSSTISFSYQELNYLYVFYEKEPLYFRLLIPRIGTPDNSSVDKMCEIACDLSAKYKVGKITRTDDAFWIAYEQLILYPDLNNDQIYDMSIKLLASITKEFKEQISTIQEQSPT